MKNAYIDSFQIHDYLAKIGYGIFPDGVSGLEFPEVRQGQYDNPGEHGGTVSNNLYGGREITLEGYVYAENMAQYETRRRDFLEALTLDRDENALPISRTFYFTTMDDLALQCEVYIRRVRFKRKNPLQARFSIDLFAPDYLLYSQNFQLKTITRASGGGAIYPVIYPVIYDPSVGGSEIVVNAGSAESWPTIFLNGPLINPIIQNDTLNRYIELMLTIPAGDQVTIDMQQKTILRGTMSVIANKTSGSKFWWLAKGSNLIKLFTGSSSDTGNAQLRHQDAHIGS